MRWCFLAAAIVACVAAVAVDDVQQTVVKKTRKHHSKHHSKHGKHHGKHHGHHHHHGKHHKVADESSIHVEAKHAISVEKTTKQAKEAQVVVKKTKEDAIVMQMKALEEKLANKKKKKVEKKGHVVVNGPLPSNFKDRFSQAVAKAIGVDAQKVKVTETKAQPGGLMAVTFMASPKVVEEVELEVTDPDSKLSNGGLHSFLVSKDDKDDEGDDADPKVEATPVEQKGLDIDTAMPYGELEPFGREDTAQELTEDSVKESNEMVDQLERAEVAEEKRAVFRSLTRLRGAAITSFDGVARSQTGNIDEYNKIHRWRNTHPLHHLADEESDIAKWAFPDNADF